MTFWSDLWARLRAAPLERAPVEEHPPLIEEHGPIEPPWSDFDGPLDAIPVGRANLVTCYGDCRGESSDDGKVTVDRGWERASMVLSKGLPGYAKPIYIHRLAEPYLREALRRAAIAAPDYRIGRLGCFAPRHQRHNSAMPLSLHSWGVAFDVDAATNGARTIKKAIEPWSPEWSELWPRGLPREFVEAIESVGWEWGGRWSGFVDPMHFQLSWSRKRAPLGVA